MVVHLDYTHEFGSSKISAFAFVFGLINQTSGYQPYHALVVSFIIDLQPDLELGYNNNYNNNRVLLFGNFIRFSPELDLVGISSAVGRGNGTCEFSCIVFIINLDICE